MVHHRGLVFSLVLAIFSFVLIANANCGEEGSSSIIFFFFFFTYIGIPPFLSLGGTEAPKAGDHTTIRLSSMELRSIHGIS